jgi:hypothetical protein
MSWRVPLWPGSSSSLAAIGAMFTGCRLGAAARAASTRGSLCGKTGAEVIVGHERRRAAAPSRGDYHSIQRSSPCALHRRSACLHWAESGSPPHSANSQEPAGCRPQIVRLARQVKEGLAALWPPPQAGTTALSQPPPPEQYGAFAATRLRMQHPAWQRLGRRRQRSALLAAAPPGELGPLLVGSTSPSGRRTGAGYWLD